MELVPFLCLVITSFIYLFCRMIATYLVHHGYCSTAEAFARSTGQEFGEEVASIKNRQSK